MGNKQTKKGHQLIIGSKINLLTLYLVNNFTDLEVHEEREKTNYRDIKRIEEIIVYINENIEKKLSLKQIAAKQDINLYYLSHFFKKKTGISFQEYINIKRLERATKLLINTDNKVTDIVFKCGFSSTNYFNRIFKEKYNCTPTEYREENIILNKNLDIDKIKNKTYLDVDRKAAFKKLLSYLNPKVIESNDKNVVEKIKKEILIDVNQKEKTFYKPYWKSLTTFGRAKEGLRSSVQNQLREMQIEIGFEYIRFHGIFMDEMMIYNLNKDGIVSYNWTYIDELFDFFMDINIKPFVELGFMPSELKRSDETIFLWKGNISPPKDIKLWTDLVKAFIKHCINRYGLQEVETWYFEVWNEPEYRDVFWAGTKEEYFEFYKETSMAIKSISKKIKVGGPSITYGAIIDSSWLDDFLLYCNKEDIVLDFVSAHIYPEYIDQEKLNVAYKEYKQGKFSIEELAKVKNIYHNDDHTLNINKQINKKIDDKLGYKSEIHITEWNASSLLGNLIHDTAYVSTFIIKNILQCINLVDSLGYWTFTDIFEEEKLGLSHFHGGFGLINKDGLKKASYYAYYLLNKLGLFIIKQGKDYIVTKNNEDIQILAYNYVYFDKLFLSGDTSALMDKNRYEIYEERSLKELEFKIKGLSGKYKITKYELNREHGSVFDHWIKIGAPENMNKEEIEYLKGVSKPRMTVCNLEIKEEYKDKIYIPVHGVNLITIEKRL